MRHVVSSAVSLVFVLVSIGCARSGPTVPPVIAKQLGGSHAREITLQVDDTGVIRRWAVRMDRDGIPDWVFDAAKRHIGPGEDVGYYIVYWADGEQTFNLVRRRSDGKAVELCMSNDHTIRHLERELGREDLPSMVAAALDVRTTFAPITFEVRDVADGDVTFAEVYFVHGEEAGEPVDLLISPDGRLVGSTRMVATELTVISGLTTP